MAKTTKIVKRSTRSSESTTGEKVAVGILGAGLLALGVAAAAHEINSPRVYIPVVPRRPRVKTVETRETDYWTGRTKITVTKEEHSPYCMCGECSEG